MQVSMGYCTLRGLRGIVGKYPTDAKRGAPQHRELAPGLTPVQIPRIPQSKPCVFVG